MAKENQQTPLNKQINPKYKTKNNRGGIQVSNSKEEQ
jgi:hypothetical protein